MESGSDSESDLEELARLREAVGDIPEQRRENQGMKNIAFATLLKTASALMYTIKHTHTDLSRSFIGQQRNLAQSRHKGKVQNTMQRLPMREMWPSAYYIVSSTNRMSTYHSAVKEDIGYLLLIWLRFVGFFQIGVC